jgi:DNA-binding transcriptional regulator GbsR (MarR family)
MSIDARSKILFGRFEALRILAAIARFSKPEFSTGELTLVTGIASAACSKELRKLDQLGLVRSVSRRGDYARVDSAVWPLVDQLTEDWEQADLH